MRKTNWVLSIIGVCLALLPLRGGISNGVSLATAFGDISIPNATFRSSNKGNMASGDVDIYTAPTGKRAIVVGASIYNPTAGSISIVMQVKIGGTYFRIHSGAATSLATTSFNNPNAPIFVLEPGDSYSINTTALGLNAIVRIIEYPSSQSPFSPRLLALANGATTLYTVPAGKSAMVLPIMRPVISTGFIVGNVIAINNSGGTLSYNVNVVPSGGSVGTTNQVQTPQSTTTTNFNILDCSATLTAGDFISVTSTAATATQFAFALIAETNAN